MKKDLTIEIIIIAFAFLCYTIRGTLISIVSLECTLWITIFSNSITVFSFFYFLLLIFDSINGLWALIEENTNNDSGDST